MFDMCILPGFLFITGNSFTKIQIVNFKMSNKIK